MRTWTEVSSPLGPLTCVVDDGFLIRVALKDQAHLPASSTFGAEGELDPQIEQQLTQYFAGDRRVFALPIVPLGTESAGSLPLSSQRLIGQRVETRRTALIAPSERCLS